MKKLITVVALIAGLAVSSNARVVDSVSKSDFKYVLDLNTMECSPTESSLLNGIYEGIYKQTENRLANFVKVDMNPLNYVVFGMRQNKEDVYLVFFNNFEVCQKLKNRDKSLQHTIHDIANYTHLVAEECSTKTGWENIVKVAYYNEKGYSIKESVEKLGLNCNK